MSDSPEGFADHAIEYLHLDKKEGYNWGFIRSSYGSVSQLCVVQMQDILGLDDKARMNIPSTTGDMACIKEALHRCTCCKTA